MAQQDSRFSAGTAGLDEAVSRLTSSTKNFQAFATEIAQMSKESFEHANHTLDKLRNAHGMEEVIAIQTNFVKEAFEHAGQYSRRMSELMSAFPLEITKSFQDTWLKSMNSAVKTAEEVSQSTAANVERFSDSIKKA